MQPKSKKILIVSILLFIVVIFLSFILAGYFLYKLYLANKDEIKNIVNDYSNNTEITLKLSDSMGTFRNDKEFNEYMKKIKKNQEESDKKKKFDNGLGDPTGTLDSVEQEPALSESRSEESITNVQEQGVDEGDIVKVYKDYFVILRRGRIFTIKISENRENTLKEISNINAYPEGYTQGTWYDEMLIYKDKIVLIGYSYEMSATEIGLFSINDFGELKHLSHYFIDSNDYYSSRNYASRLINDQLILYMPYYLYSYDDIDGEYKREVSFPQVKKWIKGDEVTDGQDILKKTDIYKPVQDINTPTLHTIVSCKIRGEGLDCGAKAIMGPYSKNFYVSPSAIYLWVSDVSYYYSDEEKDKRKGEPDSYVYMIKLDDMSARVLRADGGPIDQFSFKEEDNYLNVLVREYSGGDAMWNPEVTDGALALFRVPLDRFTDTPSTVSKEDYQDLPNISGYNLQNRFIGEHLLYGTGSTWYQDDTSQDKLYVKNYTDDSKVNRLDLLHSVDRIDIIGEAGVVVGMKDENLKFSSVDLDDISVKDTYNVGKAAQGELRSHGFSYKDNKDNTGILGLPIIRSGESSMNLFNSSAEVLFLKTEEDLSFVKLGELKGSVLRAENDNCEYSCVDWYGNSRPIFYDERIFGLMGYELIEGELKGEEISETKKVNFTP